ncbi:MAG: hypothetical protein AMXMBFR84_48670 [Candidatus Hydrogenedentota bacterium]
MWASTAAIKISRRECQRRFQELTQWLVEQSNACDPECQLPEGITIGIGGFLDYSFSPYYKRVQLHASVCHLSLAQVYPHLLHELGHARRRFSRMRYVVSRNLNPWRNHPEAFWAKEERIADAFRDAFLAMCVGSRRLQQYQGKDSFPE